jgi:superfamily II helicase
MATLAEDNVDYRLLNKLSNLVICSKCLRRGKVTPVPQVFSARHTPHNVCSNCRHTAAGTFRGKLGKVLRFRRR